MTANTTNPTSRGSTDRWENEGGQLRRPEVPSPDDLQLELRRYGIVPVQLTVFDWGGYRYTNAIAAAKRQCKSA
jgi:hypothetical protein